MKARTWLKGITIALCAATFTIACVACVPLDPNPNDDTTNKEETVEYNVTFDLNGGEAAEGVDYSARKVKQGDTITLPEAPIKVGSKFIEWVIGEETYAPGAEVTVTDNIVVKATWEVISPVVTYYDFDGSVFKQEEVGYDAVFALTTETPAPNKYGVEFQNWVAPDVERVQDNLYIHALWSYNQSDDKYFEYTETEDRNAYTVAASEGAADEAAVDTIFLPIVHNEKPVIGITPAANAESAAFTSLHATTVVIPDAYTEVADYAFANNADIETVLYCKVSDMQFADTKLTKIGSHAFYYMAKLATVFTGEEKAINILNSITEIGDYAFAFQGSVQNAQVSTGGDVLSAVRALTFEAESTLTTIGENAFRYAGFGFERDDNDNFVGFDLTIPASVETISDYAFYGARFIFSLDFEENSHCTTIGARAFTADDSPTSGNRAGYLADIFIPKSVTSIGDRAFIRQQISTFIFEKGGTEDLVIGTQVAQHTDNDSPAMTSIEFPARLKTMGDGSGKVFSNFKNLTEIKFENTAENPSRLEEICGSCFSENRVLTTVTIPQSVTTIGSSAFSGCYKLTTVNFEEGDAPLTIGDDAFSYGTSASNGSDRGYNPLTSFEFPYRTTSIGKTVFRNHHLLSSITFEATPAGKEPVPLTFVDFAFGAYTTAITSSNTTSPLAITKITVPARTETIGQGFVQGQLSLTEIEFEAGFHADIPNYFAYECPALTKIEIPEGVQKIGSYAFSAGSLTSGKYNKVSSGSNEEGNVTATATNLAYADLVNDEITTLTIPASVTEIGQYAFRNLPNLATLTFADAPAGTAAALEIDANNFDYASSGVGVAELTVTLGTTVKSVESNFCQKNNLKSITIKEGVQTIAASAFTTTVATAAVTEVTLPVSLTSVDPTAFSLPQLKTFHVASGNTVYESGDGDNGVLYKKGVDGGNRTICLVPKANTTTTFNFSNVIIGKAAFSGNTHITTLTLGTGVTIDDQAFMNCTELQTVTISAQPTFVSGAGETFKGCTKLATVTTTGVTVLCDNMFNGCVKLTAFDALEDIIDFGGEIGNVFNGCTILAWNKEGDADGITINAAITSLPAGTFQNCPAITKVNLNNVTELGTRALQGTGITEIDVSKVTTFGQYALGSTGISTVNLAAATTLGGNFLNGTQVTSVTVPSAVADIPAAAFAGCAQLKTIILEGTTAKTLGNASGIPSSNAGLLIIVADDLVDDYRAANNWKNTAIINKIVGTSTVQVSFASEGAGDASVTLPEAVTVHKNEFYTLPAAPTATSLGEDVYFAGWKVGDGTELKAAGEQVEITAATTITAVYKKKTTVTFSWGEDVTVTEPAQVPTAQKVEKGGKVIDPNVTPVCEGKTFKGWKKQGAEDTELWDFASDTVPEEGDTLELVAVWEAAAPAE